MKLIGTAVSPTPSDNQLERDEGGLQKCSSPGEKNATLLNTASAPTNLDLDINKTEKCFLSVKEGVGRGTSLLSYTLWNTVYLGFSLSV